MGQSAVVEKRARVGERVKSPSRLSRLAPAESLIEISKLASLLRVATFKTPAASRMVVEALLMTSASA